MFDQVSMRSSCRAARLSLVAFVGFAPVVLVASLPARGQDYWSLPAGAAGDWSIGSNWVSGSVPVSGDSVYIVNGGTVNVTQLGETCGTLSLGSSAGSGTVNMSGGGFSATQYAYVGNSGAGTFAQTAGTNGSSILYLANNAGATGTYNLGGSGSLLANMEFVGNGGTGTFTQTGGANTMTFNPNFGLGNLYGACLCLGYSATGMGTYALSGSGRLSTTDIGWQDFEYVGYNGTGVFNQSGGTNTCDRIAVGTYAGSSGTYNLRTGESITVGDSTVLW